MPGCSPRSRLPARGFCPNHFPGPKRRSQEPATAPLGTRGDNGGLLITPSLPFLLNINPLKQFCWQEPRPRGGEERGARPRASQGARRDGVASPSPTRTIHSEAPPMPDPRGVRGPAAPLHAPSFHLLQIRRGFLLCFWPCLTTFGWFLRSNQITRPHRAPAPPSALIIMPGYCLLTILRHCKLISP